MTEPDLTADPPLPNIVGRVDEAPLADVIAWALHPDIDHGTIGSQVMQRLACTLKIQADLSQRVRRYLQLQESPEFKPCPRCNGKGYHHGFGEHGHDPDWCEDCGGPGEVMVDDWENGDDLLKDVLAHLEAAVVTAK
jgi:hypothetical protein